MKKAQSIFEYFVVFGVLAAVLVIASGAFKKTMRDKLVEYRDYQGDRIITASENSN